MGQTTFNEAGTEVILRKTLGGFEYKEKGSDVWRELTLGGGGAKRVVPITATYTLLEEDFVDTIIVVTPSDDMAINIPDFPDLALGSSVMVVVLGFSTYGVYLNTNIYAGYAVDGTGLTVAGQTATITRVAATAYLISGIIKPVV